jgi:hypothetical protein
LALEGIYWLQVLSSGRMSRPHRDSAGFSATLRRTSSIHRPDDHEGCQTRQPKRSPSSMISLAPSGSNRRAVSSRSMFPPTCWTSARRRAHSESRSHSTRCQVSSPWAAAAPRARRTPSATTAHRSARVYSRTRARRRAVNVRTLRAARGTTRLACAQLTKCSSRPQSCERRAHPDVACGEHGDSMCKGAVRARGCVQVAEREQLR